MTKQEVREFKNGLVRIKFRASRKDEGIDLVYLNDCVGKISIYTKQYIILDLDGYNEIPIKYDNIVDIEKLKEKANETT